MSGMGCKSCMGGILTDCLGKLKHSNNDLPNVSIRLELYMVRDLGLTHAKTYHNSNLTRRWHVAMAY